MVKLFTRAPLGVILSLCACASNPPPAATTPAVSTSGALAEAKRSDLHLFSGCTATPSSGIGWSYVCKGFAASQIDGTGTDPRSMLDGPSAGFREAAKANAMNGSFVESNETYPIGGRQREGRRMTFSANGQVIAQLDSAVVPVDGAGLRLVSCGGQASPDILARCLLLLEALAREPWRDDAVRGVPVANDRLEVVGRPFDVPKNCHASKLPAGGVVYCDGERTLSWFENPTDPALERQSFAANMTGKVSAVPCTVDSAAGICDVARDEKTALYRAAAQVRGSHLVALCTTHGEGLPDACSEIFSVAPSR